MKIGIIAEGPIDHALLPPLISRIAQDRESILWPVSTEDVAERFQIRKRGFGGVLVTLRALIKALDTEHYDHEFFVILLDHRTRPVRDEVRRLISGRPRFMLGIAIEEIEAWWLGDRTNTRLWSGLSLQQLKKGAYGDDAYRAEKDPRPKKTLDEITRLSTKFDRNYGEGNVDMAVDFGENYWRRDARLQEIAQQCPHGYGAFEKRLRGLLRSRRNGPRLRLRGDS